MYLIRTNAGTARIMSDCGDFDDLGISITITYPFLTNTQKGELFEGYKTTISKSQLARIKDKFMV